MVTLMLTIGEAIEIGNEITLMVLENDNGDLRIGIDAPEGMPILKEEIYRRIIETGIGELV